MPVIQLETVVDAPRERVFDLSRSIDLHLACAADTNERAIAGVTSGLLGQGEEVTWEARHLGVKQRLRVRMQKLDRPAYFQDVMVAGAFAAMSHDHWFEARAGKTVMRDRFEFRSPLGPLGWIVDRMFLAGYMRRFIMGRNATLKRTAETEDWKRYLGAEQTRAGSPLPPR